MTSFFFVIVFSISKGRIKNHGMWQHKATSKRNEKHMYIEIIDGTTKFQRNVVTNPRNLGTAAQKIRKEDRRWQSLL